MKGYRRAAAALLAAGCLCGSFTAGAADADAKEGDVYNVLLVGVDRRDDSWNGNSDSMILLSINDEKEQISMVSLMRDTYVEIPGIGMAKLNAANANGGGDLLVETVSRNFQIPVERYAEVDFESMQELVDQVGGVELTLSDAEAEVADGYITDMCNIQGIAAEPHYYGSGGTFLCDGVQAVAYARIRYVGNCDYERTERQRTVLMEIAGKLKEMDAAELLEFAAAAMPLMTYNIPYSEILSLAMKSSEMMNYDIVLDRIPYDGMFSTMDVNGQGMLVPDWEETIAKLKETIY